MPRSLGARARRTSACRIRPTRASPGRDDPPLATPDRCKTQRTAAKSRGAKAPARAVPGGDRQKSPVWPRTRDHFPAPGHEFRTQGGSSAWRGGRTRKSGPEVRVAAVRIERTGRAPRSLAPRDVGAGPAAPDGDDTPAAAARSGARRRGSSRRAVARVLEMGSQNLSRRAGPDVTRECYFAPQGGRSAGEGGVWNGSRRATSRGVYQLTFIAGEAFSLRDGVRVPAHSGSAGHATADQPGSRGAWVRSSAIRPDLPLGINGGAPALRAAVVARGDRTTGWASVRVRGAGRITRFVWSS